MSLQNQPSLTKVFYDLTPLTMLDYPEHLACILWLAGCSMRCVYCYNPDIVVARAGNLDMDNVLSFLKKRQGLLDAVVLSGGECTAYDDIVEVCRAIKELGFKIKIDTNGMHPETLGALVEEGLISYIALDYKAPVYKFYNITGRKDFEVFSQSLDFLLCSTIPFEVRTTVHYPLLTEEDITHIAQDLTERGYEHTYYVQKYIDAPSILGEVPSQHSWLDLSRIDTKLSLETR